MLCLIFLNYLFRLPDDNPAEQAVEAIALQQLGIEVDLSP